MRCFVQSCVLLLVLSGCANNQTRPAPPAMHPGTILEQLTDFEGGPFKVPSQKPRLQILEFWASWCAPCREAMPHMDRLFRQYHTQGLSVIAVSVDEDPNDALAMVAQMRPRFPVAWDPYGDLQHAFGVNTLPTTVLIDSNGQPLMRLAGFTPENQKIIDRQIEMVLQQ